MRALGFGLLVFAALVGPADAQTLPNFAVEQWCNRLAGTGGTRSEMMYGACIDMEQSAYDALRSSWTATPGQIRDYCNKLTGIGGGSYSLLQSCVEMEISSRDQNRTKTFQR